MTDVDLPVRALPHCPNPKRVETEDRWAGRYAQEVCACSPPSQYLYRVHWVDQQTGRQLYCACGPRPIVGDWQGAYYAPHAYGYACHDCSRKLQGQLGHRLASDMLCCYCDNTAKAGQGFAIRHGHPEMDA
ncbi:hypothetical protein ADL07_11340 [Streptomyces sp. NRRL F-4707]|uniref:hypothetical protein n=1 Tax=Streptomyces sp. NRRL F-4707 TaxID=1519496 RepID=UPI0006ADBEB8|nr:hypothetical protein [Streptomyces sp. NRRL F-4707]KOX32767.1 hypothetical protein ADL07_11340 [Streptomyces sp. NRRL F-4707]